MLLRGAFILGAANGARTRAILGRALFLLAVVAGLLPWSVTRWERLSSFFGFELTRAIGTISILVGLGALLGSSARF